MSDEKLQRLQKFVEELNKDSSLNIVLSKQFGYWGAALESNPEDWRNLDGYNLLGQMRILVDLTKDIN